jgi:hypothetical protein
LDLKVPPELADEPPLAGVVWPVLGLAAVLVVAALAMTTELAPMKAPMAPPASVDAAAAAAITALVRFMVYLRLFDLPVDGLSTQGWSDRLSADFEKAGNSPRGAVGGGQNPVASWSV